MMFKAKRSLIILGFLLVAACLLAPLMLGSYPLFVLSLALINIIAALSINIVMGYAGQISLGQAGFAAIGAYTTALCVENLGLSYWIALPLGGLVAAAFGYLLGFPALRLGSLYVSMVTFGFGLVVVLILQNWYDLANGPNGISIPDPEIAGRLITSQEFHVVITAVAIVLFVVARNILCSRHGRALVAIKESELAARCMGIDVARYKTSAFALGALYAGIAGGLFAGLTRFINPDAFVFQVSILYVTMSILGGINTIVGAIVGGALLTLLPELLRSTAEYKDFLTGLLLLLLLMFLPKGLIGLIRDKFGMLFGNSDDRFSVESQAPPSGELLRSDRSVKEPLVEVTGIAVQFGGLKAVEDVNLTVEAGDIVSIIGPNGAGKTTLFNLISGIYQPTAGTISISRADVTKLPANKRVQLGVARTFQNLELFGELSVLDNVKVGAHIRGNAGFIQAAFRTKASKEEEKKYTEIAMALITFVGLRDFAHQRADSLSFGHQRFLEVARALASQPKLLLLDEPAAGLNSSEIASMMDLIRRIREELGVTILLIAHTMGLVMSLSERIIVLDRGMPLASGTPSEIQNDPRVIRAYLGGEDA